MYLIIYDDSQSEKLKRRRCFILKEGKEFRVPAEEAEKFLPMMKKMNEQSVSKPFPAIETFFAPRKAEEEKVCKLFYELLEKRNENRIKWWIAVYFRQRVKKTN